MAVRPVIFDPSGGVTVSHDDLGHGGTVAFADVRFARNPDNNTVNPLFLILSCPVCGATSVHPIAGGCDAPRIQKLFLRVVLRRAAALGIGATFPAVKAWVKARVAAMDGADRWRLEHMTTEDDDPGS